MHGAEPTQPHQLRNTARVRAIRLHRHRLKGITNVPGLQQLNRKPRLTHARIQPLRQRASLEADPCQAPSNLLNQPIKASGSLATFASRTIRPPTSTTQMLALSN